MNRKPSISQLFLVTILGLTALQTRLFAQGGSQPGQTASATVIDDVDPEAVEDPKSDKPPIQKLLVAGIDAQGRVIDKIKMRLSPYSAEPLSAAQITALSKSVEWLCQMKPFDECTTGAKTTDKKASDDTSLVTIDQPLPAGLETFEQQTKHLIDKVGAVTDLIYETAQNYKNNTKGDIDENVNSIFYDLAILEKFDLFLNQGLNDPLSSKVILAQDPSLDAKVKEVEDAFKKREADEKKERQAHKAEAALERWKNGEPALAEAADETPAPTVDSGLNNTINRLGVMRDQEFEKKYSATDLPETYMLAIAMAGVFRDLVMEARAITLTGKADKFTVKTIQSVDDLNNDFCGRSVKLICGGRNDFEPGMDRWNPDKPILENPSPVVIERDAQRALNHVDRMLTDAEKSGLVFSTAMEQKQLISAEVSDIFAQNIINLTHYNKNLTQYLRPRPIAASIAFVHTPKGSPI